MPKIAEQKPNPVCTLVNTCTHYPPFKVSVYHKTFNLSTTCTLLNGKSMLRVLGVMHLVPLYNVIMNKLARLKIVACSINIERIESNFFYYSNLIL